MIISEGQELCAQSPDIVQLEYFFDSDPGFGNGTLVTVTGDSISDTSFDIDVSGLSHGFHTVYFRAKDANGTWSLTHYSEQKIFIESAASVPGIISDITAIEYYVDTDPGFGNGTQIAVTAGIITDTDFDIDVSGLLPGFHTVYFRVKDANEIRSLTHYSETKIFIQDPPANPVPYPDIVSMEYFIDPDPSFGNGINVSLTPGQVIDTTVDLNVSGVSPGIHNLYLKVKDENNNWSLINVSSFEVSEIELTAMLEGPFNGSDMNTTVNAAGDLPLSQPFNIAPWYYQGTESVTSIPINDVVDWVLLETRNANNAASANELTVSSRFAAFMLKDGSITGLDGTSPLPFNTYDSINNYVVIHHRNHLGVLSAQDMDYSNGVYSYDFTSAAEQAYDTVQKDLGGGIFGMYAGNANGDNVIGLSDKTVWQSQAGDAGYKSADFDMNGQVDNNDKNLLWQSNYGKESGVPVFTPFACGNAYVDPRDGYAYNTVEIGTQCWMAENLAYLPSVSVSTDGNNTDAFYYVQGYQGTDVQVAKATSNYQEFGVLYNWVAAQAACPAGWHTPSDDEYKVLEGNADSQYPAGDPEWDNPDYRGLDVGANLKTTSGWNSGGNGTDLYGFSSKPAGGRAPEGSFYGIGTGTRLWTSSVGTANEYGWYRILYYDKTTSYRANWYKGYGFSVRCVKD